MAQQQHSNLFTSRSLSLDTARWDKELIQLLWNCFYHIWASQNNLLHKNSRNPSSTPALNKQIKQAYGVLQHQMASHDQQLFSKTLKDCLKTTSTSKKHWLVSVQLAVHDFMETHRRSPTQLTIPLYFSKATTNNSNTRVAPNSMF